VSALDAVLKSSLNTVGAVAVAKAAAVPAATAASAAAAAAAFSAFSALEWCEFFSRKDIKPFEAFVFPRCPTGGKLALARPGVASKLRSSAAPCA